MENSQLFDGDDEAALRYAIELSLQEESGRNHGQSSTIPIELSDDEDDDDDLNSAPVLPAVTKSPSKASTQSRPADDLNITKGPPEHPQTAGGLGGLDRKKMEQERLARLGKRKATAPAQEEQRASQRARHEINRPEQTRAPVPYATLSTKAGSSQPATSSATGLAYPKGVVKKTWAFGYPRQGDEIKIEEVLQKDKLELAVLSSFQWDDDWLMSKVDIRRTKMVCIAYAANDQQKEEMRANVPQSRIRFCFPPMLPFGNMHSKLQLLKYASHLRIVVPSGNLVPYDWGETGVMENIVFIIDLPRLGPAASGGSTTSFQSELIHFLRAQGLEESLVGSLENYDFSETSQYAFVHSIGKTSTGDEWKRTGYCGLGQAVQSLGLATSGDVNIDYVVSSLGAVNTSLLTALYFAAQGDNGMKEYDARTTKAAKGRQASSPAVGTLEDKFRIYFPSDATVSQSRGGRNAAGTICAQAKWWDAASFPRAMIHDCKSVRTGLLMHDKMMLVRGETAAWSYVGSANLSESAWGRLVKDKTSGSPKLSCRNWECGVLIAVRAGKCREWSTPASLPDDPGAVYQGSVPIPMSLPGEAYGRAGTKKPWFFMGSN